MGYEIQRPGGRPPRGGRGLKLENPETSNDDKAVALLAEGVD